MREKRFLLTEFIKQGGAVDEKTAPLIAKALLKEKAFNKKESVLVSRWFNGLSDHLQALVFKDEKLLNVLAINGNHHFVYEPESKPLQNKRRFRLQQAGCPPAVALWLSENIKFPHLMMPSGAYLYMEGRYFFDLLIKSVKKHKHLIDDLKRFKFGFQDVLNIVPNNGECSKIGDLFALSAGEYNTLIFLKSGLIFGDVDVLFHELGHMERKRAYNCFNRYQSPIVNYVDEFEQQAKDYYLENLEGKKRDLKTLSLTVQKIIDERYPSLSAVSKERLLAQKVKEEFLMLLFTDTKTREQVLNHYQKNGWILQAEKNGITEEIEHIFNVYTTYYPFFNTAFHSKDAVRRIFFKRYKNPPLFKKTVGAERVQALVLSDDFLTELNQKARFIDVQRENIFLFAPCRICLGEKRAFLATDGLSLRDEEAVLSFYKERGISFKKKKDINLLATADKKSFLELKRHIFSDYARAVFQGAERFVYIENEDLKKEELARLKREIKRVYLTLGAGELDIFLPPYFKYKKGILVWAEVLKETSFNKRIKSMPAYFASDIKPMTDGIGLKAYKKELFERFEARGLPLEAVLSSKKAIPMLCVYQKSVKKKDILSYLRVVENCLDILPETPAFWGYDTLLFTDVPAEKEWDLKQKSALLVSKKERGR